MTDQIRQLNRHLVKLSGRTETLSIRTEEISKVTRGGQQQVVCVLNRHAQQMSENRAKMQHSQQPLKNMVKR